MNLVLIGHSIIDHIELDNGTNAKPGGIFYSTLGVVSCAKRSDNLFLLTSLNEKYHYLFQKVYDQVDTLLSERKENMPEVILKVSGTGEREEVYKNLSTTLDISKLSSIKSFDGILINMITGFDINIEQLYRIRNNYSCPIYLDIHTLSRGIDTDMKRNFRPISQIEKWLSCIDILQCNEAELNAVTPGLSFEDAAKFILSCGVEILAITKAEKGAEVYFKEENILTRISVEKENVITKNKIGCGDFFGAAFFYNYISSRDVKSSLIHANKAGSVAAATQNLTSFSKVNFI